ERFRGHRNNRVIHERRGRDNRSRTCMRTRQRTRRGRRRSRQHRLVGRTRSGERLEHVFDGAAQVSRIHRARSRRAVLSTAALGLPLLVRVYVRQPQPHHLNHHLCHTFVLPRMSKPPFILFRMFLVRTPFSSPFPPP